MKYQPDLFVSLLTGLCGVYRLEGRVVTLQISDLDYSQGLLSELIFTRCKRLVSVALRTIHSVRCFPCAASRLLHSAKCPVCRFTGEVPASTVRGLNRALRTALTYSVRLSASDATSRVMICAAARWAGDPFVREATRAPVFNTI